jgi:hypothetical protein
MKPWISIRLYASEPLNEMVASAFVDMEQVVTQKLLAVKPVTHLQ